MRQKHSPLWWRIPLLILALFGLLLFLLPASMGIINVGNLTLLALSLLMGLFATFSEAATRLLKRWWRTRAGKTLLSFLAAIAGIGILSAGILSGFMISAAGRTPPETAAVVVLGCKVNGDSPSLMLTKRLEAAKRYLEQYPDKVCIVSGGKGGGEAVSEAQAMKTWLVQNGIDEKRILMEDESSDTEENISFSKRLLMQNNLGTEVAIVTDGFHQLRASLIAREQFLTPYSIPADTPWYVFPTYYIRELYALAEQIVLH